MNICQLWFLATHAKDNCISNIFLTITLNTEKFFTEKNLRAGLGNSISGTAVGMV